VGEGDRGPNTGGMGAYAPAPCMTPTLTQQAMAEIIRPTVRGLAAEGVPYRGVLYAGLMLTGDGPKLLEFNVRLGDPEAQVQLVRLRTDLGQLLLGVADGVLDHMDLRWYDEAALGVVMATRGYPGAYVNGSEIRGLDEAARLDGVTVFHAATRIEGDRVIATGGRVLNVTAQAPTCGRRAIALTPRSIGSTGRKVSAGVTSAGGRSAPRRASRNRVADVAPPRGARIVRCGFAS
jgi:phosphoribosylamine--glycine ligase